MPATFGRFVCSHHVAIGSLALSPTEKRGEILQGFCGYDAENTVRHCWSLIGCAVVAFKTGQADGTSDTP